ncbi:hypothetical protein Tco_0329083 [Tanacetum coccineum]
MHKAHKKRRALGFRALSLGAPRKVRPEPFKTLTPGPFLSEEEAERFLAIPTPPPSPLTPLSSPLPQIPSPPLLPIPAPTSSPPLLLPSTDCRADRPEVCLPPRKRMCIALGPRYEIGKSSSAPTARPTRGFRADYGFVATLDREIRRDPEREVGYGITDSWHEIVEAMQGTPATGVTDVVEPSQRMTDFVTTVRQDTDEIYGRLDEAQEARVVLSGRLNLLYRDRRSHAYTALLMKREARLSREAWRRSMDASDTARSEVMALLTIVLGQQVTALQRQQGPARGPAQPEIPEEAGSSS